MDGLPPRALRVDVVAEDPIVGDLLREALRDAADLGPHPDLADAVLWDLGHDARAGLDRLADRPKGDVPVVALLAEPGLWRVALHRGARGVLSRGAAPERLLASLRAVAAGLRVVDDTDASELPGATRPPLDLTSREREVLDLMGRGLGNRELGRELGISEHTAKFHVHAILDKLGAMTRTEAVVLAARMGLLPI
jgi:DNA-binding NarL/FixJ family response regulator